MKVRLKGSWIDAVDYDCENKIVIKVTKWLRLTPVESVYFSYPFSPKILWNYRSIGVKRMARKILSRQKNDKLGQRFVSVGKGIVEKSSKKFEAGQSVIFVATNHPEGLTRVALDESWVRECESEESGATSWASATSDLFDDFAGFELESGRTLTKIPFSEIPRLISTAEFEEEVLDDSPFSTQAIGKSNKRRKGKKVTIFGWGHHSRTQVEPHIPEPYFIDRVHDIDPLVLKLAKKEMTIDSTRRISFHDDSAVLIVAGYHHTHTDLVFEGLDRGKTVICEKPLATSWEQFAKLENLESPKLLMAYHRRYDAFFEDIRRDLNTHSAKIDYRCVVHEVSLPKNHWYNWPVSKSKIVSNGCHWIDHFLALKPDLEIVAADAFENDQGIHCHLELEDASTFNMVLSDRGSDAKGNREEIRISARSADVFIKDFEEYTLSIGGNEKRRARIKKLDVFPQMYASLFTKIDANEFDDFEDVLRTQKAILLLDQKLTE